MTVKDFKVGENAYTISNGEAKAVKIIKVGRKNVYIRGYEHPFILKNNKNNYLTENKDWGASKIIYLNKQDAVDVIDRSVIINELRKVIRIGNCGLPIDKLRKIYEIIKEET